MFTENDFKVTLNNQVDVTSFIKRHGEFACVCYDTDKKYSNKVGEHCLKSGHLSGSRHLFFDFSLENIPRFTIDQLVRHEEGIVKNVQSLRYCSKNKVSIYASPEIISSPALARELEMYESMVAYDLENLKFLIPGGIRDERLNEITRTIIPIGIASSCSFACNLEGLIHLANVRLCKRAEYPIRVIVRKMVEEVLKIEPRYKDYLVPNCIKYGYCPEGSSSCGRYPTREEMKKALAKINTNGIN